MEFFITNPMFGICLSLAIYLAAVKFQKTLKSDLLNPLLVASIVIILILMLSDVSYDNFFIGGRFISMLIGPATVALAIPLYQNLELLKKHAKTILISISSGVIAHALCIGLFAVFFKLNPEMIATYIPKSVTTAIAADVSSNLGGIRTLTICIVIVTGIFGAAIAPLINKIFKIHNPMAQGLALGVSAHAVGTSKAIELGPLQGTMSALALIVTGLITVILSPITFSIITSIL